MQKNRRKRPKRTIGLNLILWLCFLLFAIILIVIFTVVQNYQINEHYRSREKENLCEAGGVLKQELTKRDPAEASAILLSAANRYSVSAYLFSLNGEFIFPVKPGGNNDEYRQTFEFVKGKFDGLDSDKKEKAQLVFSFETYAGYATIVNLGNKNCYLYLSSSFDHLIEMTNDTLWMSLVTALLATVLAFVVSGFVSMAITKPVTDVTERAKELARGNYEAGFTRNYFFTELNQLSDALNYASSEISKTDKMQKELIANVSHDFKTPLTMIKAYAAMIAEISGNDPVKRVKHTQIIIDETDRLTALVEDVLDLSKLQSGIETIERTVFNLSEDLYGVVNRFGFLTSRGYKIETDIDDDLYTYASRERTGQVFYNLIGNAINYTGEDMSVVIRLKKKESGVRFEVIDTGRGIPPEQVDTIWQRYYRSGETHKRPIKGSGLGLSIVESVLKKHGIPFGVQSEVGKGSCFWVDFPDPPEDEKSTEANGD